MINISIKYIMNVICNHIIHSHTVIFKDDDHVVKSQINIIKITESKNICEDDDKS